MVLRNPYRPRTNGRFAYGCSQARKASARVRMVPTRALYGTRRVDVRILMIPKNTDNQKNASMHMPMHIEEGWFHTAFPRVIGPTASQVLRFGTTCGHYAMWSHAYGCSMGHLCFLWSRSCKISYVYLDGSVRYTCGHLRGPYGFYTHMGTSVHSVLREPYGPVRMLCGLGNTRTISGAGPYWVWWIPRMHAWIILTKPNTIMWHLPR